MTRTVSAPPLDLLVFAMIGQHAGQNRGGVSVSLRRLANALAQRGLAVELMVARNACTPVWLASLDERVRVTPLGRLSRLALSLHLLVRLWCEPPRALLVMDERAAQIAGAIKAWPGIAVDLWLSPRNAVSAPMRDWPPQRRERRVAQMRRVHARARGVIPISDGLARDYCETLRVGPHKVHAIHNPVLDEPLMQLAAQPVEWPGAPPAAGTALIVAVGRLTLQKDFPTLLRAFAQLRIQHPARLIILGEGDQRLALQTLADELGIGADIELPGFRTNPYALLSQAQLFVLSSRWEGFGNVLAEALALGVNCVSTRCPHGPEEILDHGRHGALVPVGDAVALADAMLHALRNPQSPESLRAAASRFDAGAVAARYAELMGL